MSAFDQTVVLWIRIALLGAIVVLGFGVMPPCDNITQR